MSNSSENLTSSDDKHSLTTYLPNRLRNGLWSKDPDDLNPWQQDVLLAADRIEQVEAELIRTHRLMMEDAKRVECLEAIMQKLVEPFKKALPLFGAQNVRSIKVGDQVVEELLAALEGKKDE